MTNNPRNRVVVFRLSQDEYVSLKEASERVGARNMSDFARSGILEHLESATAGGTLNQRFAALEREIAALQQQFNNLVQGVLNAKPRTQP